MMLMKNPDVEGCGCTLLTPLLPVDDAVAQALTLITPMTRYETVSLTDALGRVLARPVTAQSMTPPFDCSAMDGFAVRSADCAGDFPYTLKIQDQISAGDGRQVRLAVNAAMRIFTGAPMPLGADTVIMQEHTTYDSVQVQILQPVQLGNHVRRQGEDMQTGATILSAGCRIRPCEIAAAAAAGQDMVSVVCQPRVTLLTSGDEITTVGATLSAGKIWDVNTPMLLAALKQAGADVVIATSVKDDETALARQLEELAQASDLIVTTGGVSVGASDFLRPAFRRAGGEIHLSGVAMKPGKPVCVGVLDNTIWLGMPGNPLAAFITWQVIGAQLLAALQGAPVQQSRRNVLSKTPLLHKPGRCEYRPARIVGLDAGGLEIITCLSAVHSAHLTPLVDADGLIVIPADTTSISADEPIEFIEFTR